MIIKDISVKNLRNHKSAAIEFSDGINVIHGLNGSGKTTLLEAISICAMTKSFLPVNDYSLINYDEDFYRCELNAVSDLNSPYKIRILYEKNKKKQINSTEGDNLYPKDVIGDLPVIILSPDFKAITFGSPSDRRQFLDKIISQSSGKYISNILKMKKSIKQRNSVLLNGKKHGTIDYTLLDTWTDIFIKNAAEVVLMRYKFIKILLPYFLDYYSILSNSKEKVNLIYKPNHVNDDILNDNVTKDEIANYFRQEFSLLVDSEIKRGTSLFGPQKDEVLIYVNKGLAKEVASQGQHKSLLISLKFAEYEFLKESKRENPVILLDDIFSELDIIRSNKVLSILSENKAQTIISVTDRNIISNSISDCNINYIEVFS